MSNTRLTVVVRKDLNMPAGLLAAQVAHISSQWVHDILVEASNNEKTDVSNVSEGINALFTTADLEWMQTPYLSVLAVECREDLEKIIKDCKSMDIAHSKWVDTVPSPTFEGDVIPEALVGVAIGPADFDVIKSVTVRLSSY